MGICILLSNRLAAQDSDPRANVFAELGSIRTVQSSANVQTGIFNPYDTGAFKPFRDTVVRQIDSFFRKHYKWGNFNGTYLFFKGDSMHTGSMGYATFSTKDTAQPQDLFQLASVSKTFTGVATMLMVQDGYFQLDDSVHWYLPEFKIKTLTLRHLVSHTSGLPDYFYVDIGGWQKPRAHMDNEDVLQLMNAQKYSMFGKIGKYDYCNSNFALLALVIERLTDMDFRDFVRQRIMIPAGMRYSHICNLDSMGLSSYVVQGYDKKKVYSDNPYNGATGDKGVYSSVLEMWAFDKALRTNYILHEPILNEMTTPQVPTTADAFYALGWRVKWVNGQKWTFHNGWWKGFRTYYWRCIDEPKGFVVLTNNVQGPFLSTAELLKLINF